MEKDKAVRIGTIEELNKLLFEPEYQADIGRYRQLYVYRGLSNDAYRLESSLQRFHGDRHMLFTEGSVDDQLQTPVPEHGTVIRIDFAEGKFLRGFPAAFRNQKSRRTRASEGSCNRGSPAVHAE